MINIKKVSWRNFLGYGDYQTTVNFHDYHGVCMIEGEHEENSEREEGDEKLNNSGKTSIIEAMIWGLFGNLTRKQNIGDKVINWHTGKNCMVTIDTEDGYQISRMRKYKSMTETIMLKDGEDITRSTNMPVQDQIDKIFDINYETFIRSRVFGQFNTGFMELSDTKMRKVLEWLMSIHNLNPRAKTAKEKVAGCTKKIDKLVDQVEYINSNIESLEAELSDLTSSANHFKTEIQDEIDQLKQKLLIKKQKVDEEIKLIHEEISTKRKDKNNLSKIDIDQLTKEWQLYEAQINEIERIDISINSISIEIKKSEESVVDLIDEEAHSILVDEYESNKIKLQEKRDTLTKLIKESERNKVKIENEQDFLSKDHKQICSECRQSIQKEYIQAKLDEASKNVEELSEQNQKLTNKIKELKNLINDLSNKTTNKPRPLDEIIEHNNTVRHLTDKIDKLKKELHDIKEEKEKINILKKPTYSIQEAKSNNKYLEAINQNIIEQEDRAKAKTESFKEKTIETSSAIKKIKQKENPYQKLVAIRSQKLREIKEEKVAKEKELVKLKALKNHLDYIRESYGNKRKIKAFWISELIPEFNKYLDYYQDFFEVTNKIKFDELLSPKMTKWGYFTSSGGECKRIDLSIMFALNDLHVSNFGPQSNFMVLDEVDGRLDPFTMNKLVSLLNDDLISRDDGLTNIFIISHRKEMKDRFPNKIRVKYKQEKSHIING